MEDDPMDVDSVDPWDDAEAPHPDENALDTTDQRPQPEDEQKRNPDT
jgi:hypothetical protein